MRSTIYAALIFMTTAGGPGAAGLPEPLKACVDMRRDSERLACYDRAVAAIESGATAPTPSPENMFGANVDTEDPPEDSDNKRDELRQISGAVTSTRHADDGMIVVTLYNGQVWRQQDGNVTLTIDSGDTVTVVRASMGTFRITDKRGRSARFKRLR
jgi:hypothetical protein